MTPEWKLKWDALSPLAQELVDLLLELEMYAGKRYAYTYELMRATGRSGDDVQKALDELYENGWIEAPLVRSGAGKGPLLTEMKVNPEDEGEDGGSDA